ncbi:MAG: ABC transporter permease [Paracoccaceae bacterium]
MRQTLRCIGALILREMATTYGRSPGGYVWALVEPIGAIVALSVVFSYAFRDPALGTNFALFYATAYLPFMMFSDLSVKIALAIRFSLPLFAYPSVSYIDSIFARTILCTLTHLIVFNIVIFGISLTYSLNLMIDFPLICLGLFMAASLGFSLGVLNCFLFSMFPAWQTVWSILMRPMFILSGVFFILESIPRQLADILWYNPVIHVTGVMRKAFYPTYDANYVSYAYALGVCAVVLSLGLLLLHRHHRHFINR